MLHNIKIFNFSDNSLTELNTDLLPAGNKISKFLAAKNQLTIIELQLIKRMDNAIIIDFSSNKCIDAGYTSKCGYLSSCNRVFTRDIAKFSVNIFINCSK